MGTNLLYDVKIPVLEINLEIILLNYVLIHAHLLILLIIQLGNALNNALHIILLLLQIKLALNIAQLIITQITKRNFAVLYVIINFIYILTTLHGVV
jgi:hypothetical protein